jgi:hypothetical protein
MKLKGGMVNIKSSFTPKSAFNFFLNNSNILYFSHGSYGLIFKATLNNSILDNDIPYESFEPHLGFIALRKLFF